MVSIEPVWSAELSGVSELQEFLAALDRCRTISRSVKQLFHIKARQQPALRLSINLRSFLGLAATKEINNILLEGFTAEEHASLVALDSSDLPVRLKEIGHGLHNAHARWILSRALCKQLKAAHSARYKCIDFNPSKGQ